MNKKQKNNLLIGAGLVAGYFLLKRSGNLGGTVTRLKKGDKLEIIGKLWFDKANRNTYHSSTVILNGKEVAYVPITYGYEDAYITTGIKALKKTVKMPYKWDNDYPLWYLKDFGIQLITSKVNVLKRDL